MSYKYLLGRLGHPLSASFSSNFKRPFTTMIKERVCLIGSGNWGSAVGKIVGQNVLKYPAIFESEVRQWVFEENYKGEKLTDVINREHENPKYLPGIKFPSNVRAVPDLIEACEGASVLVFVLPHQFVRGVCDKLQGRIAPTAKAISLIKGLEIKPDGVTLFSEEISRLLGINVAALSGANIANEVAMERFCETTIGCRSDADGQLFFKLFNTPYFRVNVIRDYVGVELCGALKNVVAVGAGLSDGLGYGSNTKAAIIRLGLMEMRKFGQTFFGGVEDTTFFESCGVADLITTCSGGRNRKVAEAFAQTGKPIDELERELLNGQKLQGTLTAEEVHSFLAARNMTSEFPLFETVYRIIYEGAPIESIVRDI
ncbi:glycerol-3-phosphate dehydrogenase [NAD+] [Radiomyces spectabilis]|uniref:glycerol-3-phosphate dehydrogenase [NAD+] n=1 Tax=Radiomyces spectabilis TaxID=64574 RepID=UPI00222043ED|nr:glycerol-3-phosphate dehydrogenase [NAD+] [Radiomyces spectabilis]KAI8379076.1 glycerol-3-phosphate dehydrogenase [NAD+] [Radiomyces spectabilis]